MTYQELESAIAKLFPDSGATIDRDEETGELIIYTGVRQIEGMDELIYFDRDEDEDENGEDDDETSPP